MNEPDTSVQAQGSESPDPQKEPAEPKQKKPVNWKKRLILIIAGLIVIGVGQYLWAQDFFAGPPCDGCPTCGLAGLNF